jgi:hypothetical protein
MALCMILVTDCVAGRAGELREGPKRVAPLGGPLALPRARQENRKHRRLVKKASKLAMADLMDIITMRGLQAAATSRGLAVAAARASAASADPAGSVHAGGASKETRGDAEPIPPGVPGDSPVQAPEPGEAVPPCSPPAPPEEEIPVEPGSPA